jgi:hypothetical protein
MNPTPWKPGAAPAVVRPGALRDSLRVQPLTCAIGAEVGNVDLGDAARDDTLFAEIRGLWLAHRVLFFRDQDISRADHVAFARRFGDLEDHPVAGSDPDHPGLVQIYKTPYKPNDRYEMHGTPTPPGARSRRWAPCCAASSARPWAATRCGRTWCSPTRSCPRP